jgi:uncharacterized membrane protein (UPF0127 family)
MPGPLRKNRHAVRWASLLAAVFAFTAAIAEAPPEVAIVTASGTTSFRVEIAATTREREIGLQRRISLAPDRGMLFLYPATGRHKLWMKNTPIPLDMIFIDKDLKVVGVVENATPNTHDTRTVSTPSRYVLEINGGLAQRFGIRTGDEVRFSGIGERR